jgi:hypothetical protein
LNILTHKLKEVLFAVLPITVVVLILGFTLAPLETPYILRFLVGAVSVILGLSIFLFGVDLGITPMGNEIGASLIKTNKLWIITCAGFFLAFIVSVAEPDLHILADQVNSVTSGMISKTSIVVIVSLGVGAMLSVGLIRIVKNIPLYIVLTIFYGIILILSLFTTNEFIAISFDASGATTGALTVPFILAIAIGVSKLKKDSKASEKDSFGLVAIASIGAIIAVMVMSIISGSDRITASLEMESSTSQSIFGQYFSKLPGIALESFFALLPLFAILMLFQKKLKLSRRTLRRMILGFLYTLIGLALFLTGVNAGFMDAGRIIGYKLAMLENKFIIIATGFALGFTTILAEPAVYVLTKSIENVTSGYIKRRAVLIALSIGIGIAVALSTVRILVPELQLWHYLLPGYIISIAMSYIAPNLFVGIAFDSGGVASGPMTATFILAFTQGAAEAIETADVLIDGFGMIAAVALMPLIALQTLGIIYKIKSKKGGLEVGKLPD